MPKWLFFLILSSGCGVSSNFGICLLRGRLALKPTPKRIFVFQLDLELMLSLSCSPPRVWHQSCKKGRFSSSFVAPGGLILIAPSPLSSSSATFGLDSLSLSLSGAKRGLDVIRAVNKEQGHTARAARSFAPRPPPYRHPQILGWRYQHFTACVFSMQSSLNFTVEAASVLK